MSDLPHWNEAAATVVVVVVVVVVMSTVTAKNEGGWVVSGICVGSSNYVSC